MKVTYQRIRNTLQKEQTVLTLRCPPPESFWKWLEQGDDYPEAPALLEHIFLCAYCRQEHLAQLEIRVLTGRIRKEASLSEEIRLLPVRVRNWVEELLQEGITTPIRSAQTALHRMDRLTAIHAPATLKSRHEVFNLSPAFTILRTTHPVLRWSSRHLRLQFEIQLWHSVAENREKLIWEGNAGSRMELPLPNYIHLKSKGNYFWQVIARTDSHEWYSPCAPFTVSSEQMLRQIEELEHKSGDSPLARIGIYEAYGLYEEALKSVETMLNTNVNDPVAQTLKAKLQQRAQLS